MSATAEVYRRPRGKGAGRPTDKTTEELIKEVFVRILVTISLFAVYFNYITLTEFVHSLVLIYGISLLVIIYYANKTKRIQLNKKLPKKTKEIFVFTIFIILSASVANMLLDIDKYMINQFLKIENIAFYSLAVM